MAIRRDEIAAAAESMMQSMFAPHELPLDVLLRLKYWNTAKAALEAVEQVRRFREKSVNKGTGA